MSLAACRHRITVLVPHLSGKKENNGEKKKKKGPVFMVCLEFLERLHALTGAGENAEDVEANLWQTPLVSSVGIDNVERREGYSFRQRPALTDGNLITLLDTESWRNVCRDVLVALLVTLVLRDIVQVVAADDEGSVHLC